MISRHRRIVDSRPSAASATRPALLPGGAAPLPAQASAASFADALDAGGHQRRSTRCRAPSSCRSQALKGKADTREVVDAVMSAEQALQTAVAIRDKIVSAYLEISRMAI